ADQVAAHGAAVAIQELLLRRPHRIGSGRVRLPDEGPQRLDLAEMLIEGHGVHGAAPFVSRADHCTALGQGREFAGPRPCTSRWTAAARLFTMTPSILHERCRRRPWKRRTSAICWSAAGSCQPSRCETCASAGTPRPVALPRKTSAS